jgi:dynactin 1
LFNSELENLRTQTQSAQTEATTHSAQAANLISLNMKLQSSFAKSSSKALDAELTVLEAAEMRELLGIIQPYLPPLYVEQDSGATEVYMFFGRIARKCEVLSDVVAKRNSMPDSLWADEVTESLVGVCEVCSTLQR